MYKFAEGYLLNLPLQIFDIKQWYKVVELSTKLRIPDRFQGGASFLVVKGLFKVYYKQQQHVMQSRRKIIDYPQEPATPQTQPPTPQAPPPTPQDAPQVEPVPTTLSPSSGFEMEQQYLQQHQQ